MRRVTFLIDEVPVCWNEYPYDTSLRQQIKTLAEDHECTGDFIVSSTTQTSIPLWAEVVCLNGRVIFMKGPFFTKRKGHDGNQVSYPKTVP
jgi:hypothetical protein